MGLSLEEQVDLAYAKSLLENPGLAAKIINYLGVPLEKGIEYLPKGWHENLTNLTQSALEKAIDAALFTLDDEPGKHSRDRLHKLAVGATGAVGGVFGWSGLAIELPLSTTVMLRSIADVARSEGELIRTPATRLACIEVFALGGRATSDDASESAYFVTRSAIAAQMREAAAYLSRQGATKEAVPALVKLLTTVLARFNIQVEEKVLLQAIPVVGAVGGAVINVMFIDHFQDMARGHFIVRRLERKYSPEIVEDWYRKIAE